MERSRRFLLRRLQFSEGFGEQPFDVLAFFRIGFAFEQMPIVLDVLTRDEPLHGPSPLGRPLNAFQLTLDNCSNFATGGRPGGRAIHRDGSFRRGPKRSTCPQAAANVVRVVIRQARPSPRRVHWL